ncbi:FK506-binding protein 2A [Helicostylum pulchrum]|nr:FK506-binding protein 2A [Helicostylum pulchrum]
MLSSLIYKLTAVFVMATTVYALSETNMEQPTKLLGGILSKPETCGYKVSSNSEITVHYRARVWGEEEFYENTYLGNGTPLKFKLGRDKIMKGLEQGIHGMCTDEVRRLIIPADLAYGEFGLPNLVPGNTAVIYEVEVTNVNSPFTNPWFWSGAAAITFAFVFFNRFQNYFNNSKSANFLKQKSQEKKSE